jgi:hypothetical protein
LFVTTPVRFLYQYVRYEAENLNQPNMHHEEWSADFFFLQNWLSLVSYSSRERVWCLQHPRHSAHYNNVTYYYHIRVIKHSWFQYSTVCHSLGRTWNRNWSIEAMWNYFLCFRSDGQTAIYLYNRYIEITEHFGRITGRNHDSAFKYRCKLQMQRQKKKMFKRWW